MYTITTQFIKGQIPGTTLADLLDRYQKELQDQNVSSFSQDQDIIDFNNSNAVANIFLNSYGNRFSGFANGHIKIVDNDTEYIVYLKADISRLFILPGIISGLITLFFLIASGFTPFLLSFGMGIFIIISLIKYISFSVTFPIYFTKLRNDIENERQL